MRQVFNLKLMTLKLVTSVYFAIHFLTYQDSIENNVV